VKLRRSKRPRIAGRGAALVLSGLGLAACETLIGADFDAQHGRHADEPMSQAGCAADDAQCTAGATGGLAGGASEPMPVLSLGGSVDVGGADAGTGDTGAGTRRLDARGIDAALVSRRPGLLDLFVVTDGRIAFNRYDGRVWSAPEYLGGPDASAPTSRLAAVAATFNPDRIDVFAVGEDGSIYRWHSSAGAGAVEWSAPQYLSFAGPARPSGGIAVASWQPQRLDAFWICPSGNLGHFWSWQDRPVVESGDDESVFYLRPIAPVAWRSQIKAVSSARGRLDIFMLAGTGRALLHHWHVLQDESFWGAPQRPHAEQLITGDPHDVDGVLDDLAVANVREGLDVFLRFRGTRGALRRLRLRDGAWATSPVGESMPQLEALGVHVLPTIFDASSWSPPALDIFGADRDGRVVDVWLGDYQSP
jgi:hypothetical protein